MSTRSATTPLEDPVREYLRLKEAAEEARRDADRAAGAAAQLRADIEEQYGSRGLKAAERLLRDLQAKEKQTREAIQDALGDYAEEFLRSMGEPPSARD